ncbi:NF038215 family lipoprotein [Acinetobacter schindleri]|uniref:NF038215 family lipoprotein n=1 Tax=Acinetobacter schindleri TaxID=108981 RepID=UPI0032B3DF1C
MKHLSYAVLALLLSSLTGCDNDKMNKPKTEVRTMIIGGMPVHDHDYHLSKPQFIVQDVQ